MNKFLKLLDSYKHKYFVSKILLLIKNNQDFQDTYKHLDYLFSNSYNLLNNPFEQNKNVYNIIDNNLFEIENIIEEIELVLNDLVKVELYVFLNSKSTSYLNKFYDQLLKIIEESISISNAVRSIKPFQKNILRKFIDKLYIYLSDEQMLHLINIDRINAIINQDIITISDWNNINKTIDTLFKQINPTQELINEKFKFELVLFLLNVEE